MGIQDRDWYRVWHRELRQAELQRQARRKLWLVRATIGVLFAIVFALAVPLLGSNVATNMRCSRGPFPVAIFLIGEDCPGGITVLRGPRS